MCIKGLKGYIVDTQLLPILLRFIECLLGDQHCWNTENLSVDIKRHITDDGEMDTLCPQCDG